MMATNLMKLECLSKVLIVIDRKRDRWTFSYLDAPSSTSSLTYKVKSSNYSTNKIHVNEQSNIDGSSYIQLMEIKG